MLKRIKEKLKEQGLLGGELLKTDLWEKIEKTLENVLNQEQDVEQYIQLMDAIPCTLSWIDSDLNYKAVNQHLADQCGIDKDEFVGKKVGFYTHESEFCEWIEQFFISKNRIIQRELAVEINNHRKYFFVTGQKFNFDKEAVVIGLDITNQRLAEKALESQEKIKSGNIAVSALIHEISNPLSSVLMKAEKIAKVADDESQKDIVQKHSESIISLIHRISGIMDEVRNVTKEKPIAFTRVDLNKIITEVKDTFEDKLSAMGIDVKSKCLDKEVIIKGSPNQLFEVVANLVTNARDAVESYDDKWISIEVNEDDDNYILSITDSGNGIPEDVQKQLFTPFYTTKSDSRGTGLGLTIIEKIVRSHHGTFYLDNKSANTRFVAQLPKVA